MPSNEGAKEMPFVKEDQTSINPPREVGQKKGQSRKKVEKEVRRRGHDTGLEKHQTKSQRGVESK